MTDVLHTMQQWNAPCIYQLGSSGAPGKTSDLGNLGVQHETARQEIKVDQVWPESHLLIVPHLYLFI